MNISEKIEEIRRKPEHIRLRYVWGCVAVSMLVILAIWLFSVVSMFGEDQSNPIRETGDNISNIQQKLQDIKNQTPSLNDLGNQPLDIGNEGVASGFQYPVNTSPDSNAPQSATYSNLPGSDSQQ